MSPPTQRVTAPPLEKQTTVGNYFVSNYPPFSFWKPEGVRGPAATDASFLLVFSVAIAITSIPVISRIMFDLGILESWFARIVLTVGVVEDVILFVLLTGWRCSA